MAAWHRLVDLLLGTDSRRRLRASQSMLVSFIVLVMAGMQHAEVLAGLIDRRESNLLSAVNIFVTALSYVLIRSGWSERLAADPALTLPQMLWGVLITSAAYAITGPARGAVLALLVLIVVFGMFALTARRARALSLFALALVGAVMVWKSQSQPLRYPPIVEAVHLVFVTLVLGGVSTLSLRMGALHSRLRAQKQALTDRTAALQQALEQIRLLASRDELTGLCNRRYMRTLLLGPAPPPPPARLEVRVLVLMDLDFFKRINDSHGHSAGDTVLKRFAEVGLSVLRSKDVLARWGGEEFLLMLPDTTPPQALACIDRLREVLRQTSFDDVAPGLKPTFSAGLSVCEQPEQLDAAIEQADQAMYRAKSMGRNRTEVATA